MKMTQQLVYPLQREIKKAVTEHVSISTQVCMHECNKSGNIESLLVSRVRVRVCMVREITMTGRVTINMASCEAVPLLS